MKHICFIIFLVTASLMFTLCACEREGSQKTSAEGPAEEESVLKGGETGQMPPMTKKDMAEAIRNILLTRKDISDSIPGLEVSQRGKEIVFSYEGKTLDSISQEKMI